jgi:signal transduction histidine kinase
MVIKTEKLKYGANIGIGLIVLIIIFLTGYYNYLLFHSIAELFSILIAFSIFIIGWNSRRYMKNTYFLFIGIVYLFVGLLDLLHTLAYSGMGVFLEFDANLPTQLWIAARYFEALSLLVAIVLINKKIDYKFLFLFYSIIFSLLIGTIFYWRIFPTCYIEGVGLTSFKINSEYVINVILFITILIMFQRRALFEKHIFIYLIISTIFTIIAEMAFTFYVSVFGFSNFVGHIFKIISFYLVYKAIIETGLKKPYTIIFRDLKLREEELLTYHTQLENLVEQRTIKLKKSEEKYRKAYHRVEFYKDLFAHDINNILHGLLSGFQVCEISIDDPEEIKKSINIMKTQVMRGSKLVSNIYNLSKLEESKIPLEKKDISKVLKKSVASIQKIDRERSVNIEFNFDDQEFFILGNDLLEDLFDNILNNAIKHNKNPTVEIKIKISKQEREHVNYLKMEFLDNGKGVSDTRKEKIFSRGNIEIKSVYGMGLGLSLAKKIIETYNGEIWVEDRVKGDHLKGSDFILLIPEVN